MTRLLPGDSLTLDLAPEGPADLLARLRAAGVAMNESAERLIAELHLPDGGTLPELRRAVAAAGLRECPPAVAPLLRLATLDQANAPDSVLRHGRAPDGSAQVLSPSLGDESGVHRGLYLRVVDRVPWLRGFACDDLHVFGPEDRWILAQ